MDNSINSDGVRIVLKRNFKDQPLVSIRGNILESTDNIITIIGIYTQEITDSLNGKIERPLSLRARTYLIPLTSIRYIVNYNDSEDIIAEHKDILTRNPINKSINLDYSVL